MTDIAAYIWPAYHHEPRLERFWPEGDGEWYTVRRATPRFPGHDQPRVPLLGYQDEADPQVMAEQFALGARYGVNTFIVDWYWYDDAPCFERQLDAGILPALAGSGSRFYLMWANHEATTAWNMHTDEWRHLWTAQVDRRMFEQIAERWIDRYFAHPNYYRIDGKPVLSIYHLANLVAGLGGLAAARAALDWLRARAVTRGLRGLHLQGVLMDCPLDVARSTPDLGGLSTEDLIVRLGLDSTTCYQYVHHAGPTGDYRAWAARSITHWRHWSELGVPFFPHVSIGWDNTMRLPSLAEAVSGSSSAAFADCLRQALAYLDEHPAQPRLVTINSWNEWTEGSYLLPDERHGYGYLEAVAQVLDER